MVCPKTHHNYRSNNSSTDKDDHKKESNGFNGLSSFNPFKGISSLSDFKGFNFLRGFIGPPIEFSEKKTASPS